MYYAFNFILPANQSEVTRTKQELYLEKGTITQVEVVFPVGCANLVFVHINDALHQVYPKSTDYQFVGDGSVILCSDEYELVEAPFTLQFYGWNEDEIYKHMITVRIQLLPAKEILHKVIGGMSRITSLRKPKT